MIMTKLPKIKPKELLSKLKKIGFQELRTKGSHIILAHPDGRRTLVAYHNKPIASGTLRAILKQTELRVEDVV